VSTSPGPSCRVPVRVTPRSKRPGVHGVRADGAILVAVSAPPEDGRANDAVCAELAKVAGLRARAVTVVRGHTSRDKLVELDGISEAALRAHILGVGG